METTDSTLLCFMCAYALGSAATLWKQADGTEIDMPLVAMRKRLEIVSAHVHRDGWVSIDDLTGCTFRAEMIIAGTGTCLAHMMHTMNLARSPEYRAKF